MEGYIEEEADDQEAVDEGIITLDDISFGGKTLQEYETEFTVKLPAIPCTSTEILGAISHLGNAYQVAYNNSARLLIVVAKAGKDYKIKRNELITEKISALRALNPGKPTKLPSKETIESMVIAESEELETLIGEWKKWEVVKEWFESHVKKLGAMLISAKDISYGVNNTDRMYSRGQV